MIEIEKLNSHIDEWNAIMPFFEWLSAHQMCIAKWRTQEEVGEERWLLEHPYPTGNYANLLYDYFGVDPNKLEAERRAFLFSLNQERGSHE